MLLHATCTLLWKNSVYSWLRTRQETMQIILLKTTKTVLCFVHGVGSTECQHAQSHTLRWNPSFTPMCCCRKGRVPDIRWGSRRLSSHYRIPWFSSIFGYFMFYLTLWRTILINLCFNFIQTVVWRNSEREIVTIRALWRHTILNKRLARLTDW